MISQEAYTKVSRCPMCDKDDMSYGAVDLEGEYAFREVDCRYCLATWTDVYQLVGFSNLCDDQGNLLQE